MLMRTLRRMQPLFVLLALLFMALLLRSQWEELQTHQWQLNPRWLVASAGLLVAAWAVEIVVWLRLLRTVGGRLGYWPGARIWFLSAIVRYIPGNVWQPLSMTLLCQRRGVKPEATVTSILLYQVIILLAVTPIAALYFGATGNWGLLTDLLSGFGPWLIGIGLAPLAAFLVRPALLIDVVNWVLRRFGRAPLETGFARGELLVILALAVADWVLWGASFCALAFGLNVYSAPEMLALAPHLIAVYSVAYAIGLVSLLTPSGLGVRE
ncbi:MAG: flippase-like domain-containing protein, partial [Caldilineaceae bacterium]|nr:flippase-like domain-containing protein [Caldilineaceae bacterium]